MKELNENIVRVLEDNGFYVGKPDYSNQHKEYCIEINQYTDLGEDWWMTLWYDGTDEDFIQKFETMVEYFDPDEEAEIYIEMRGKNGVPDSIRDILNDQEWKLETLRTTFKELKKEFEDFEEEESETEDWKVFYVGAKEICAYTIFGEGAGEEEATKELLAAERGLNPEDITCYVVKR
jgi:hypothetical protein